MYNNCFKDPAPPSQHTSHPIKHKAREEAEGVQREDAGVAEQVAEALSK